VDRWTGRESRLLRHALRRSVRSFADHLGVSARTISKWEQLGSARSPRPEFQVMLDTVLACATDDERARFHASLTPVDVSTTEQEDATNRRQFLVGAALTPPSAAAGSVRPCRRDVAVASRDVMGGSHL
jgi:transcriptional regulator with XRE-family HTH domain